MKRKENLTLHQKSLRALFHAPFHFIHKKIVIHLQGNLLCFSKRLLFMKYLLKFNFFPQGYKGITTFIVPPDTEGLSLGKKEDKVSYFVLVVKTTRRLFN